MTRRTEVPLTAFRVFVAIGRYGNFTRAATALGITQSAVSRQVARLEALAGATLFRRTGATVAFTSEGRQLHDALKDAISTLELTAQQLVQKRLAHDRLIVRTSMPSFAMKVVVPLLGEFSKRHGIQIDLVTSMATPLAQDEFDVLISRHMALPDAPSWELVRERLVCVASPACIGARASDPQRPWPMIRCRLRPDAIAAWAMARDIAADMLQTVASYDHFFLAVEAAIGGVGFLVIPEMLVRDALHNGILLRADDTAIASGATYTAYVNPASRHLQQGERFCRWLKGMLRDSPP